MKGKVGVVYENRFLFTRHPPGSLTSLPGHFD